MADRHVPPGAGVISAERSLPAVVLGPRTRDNWNHHHSIA